jgi:hypothetical protein
VVLGQLEGGSKERDGFADLVRLTAELLSGLALLVCTPHLRVLLFHGPLVSLLVRYTGHSPFTEGDIDLFLRRFAPDPALGRTLKEDFLAEARRSLYPAMTPRAATWAERRLFEPLAWLAFLYHRLIAQAGERRPVPIIAGVVERGHPREFAETVLLRRVFVGLRARGNADYFNRLYGRTDLTSPRALLDRLGYTDTILLGMLLRPCQASEPWLMDKYAELITASRTPARWGAGGEVSYTPLVRGPHSLPTVRGCYVSVSETVEPIRVETFDALGPDQPWEAARRAYLYARLLPGYGFPVGLDIVDKYAAVPEWLTAAYAKLIRHQLGVSLQRGEVDDAEMRRILVQALHMRHRDWLLRPGSVPEARP